MKIVKNAAVALALAVSAFAGAAQAAITFDASAVGNAVTINYNGFDTPDGSGGTYTGLTAQGIFTLTSIVGADFNFSYSILNTSSAPVLTSRVSVFGFDMSPAFSVVTLFTPPGSVFTDIGTGSNVPNLTGSDANRICFRAGGGGSQCAGGGGGGVAIGDPAATGTFRLNAGPGVTSLDLDRFFVRYQSISGLGRVESATGLGTPGAVPEPATWLMMLAGLGIIGSSMRRKRRIPSFA